MKKLTIGIVIAAIATLALAGTVMAQTPATDTLQYGNGNGNVGSSTGDSYLHEYIVDYFADVFLTSADVLNERLDKGESMTLIAISYGYSVEDFYLMMDDARLYALDQALADGIITQDQYDQMLTAGTGIASNVSTQTQSRMNGSAQGQNLGNDSSRSQMGNQDGTGPLEDCLNTLP